MNHLNPSPGNPVSCLPATVDKEVTVPVAAADTPITMEPFAEGMQPAPQG